MLLSVELEDLGGNFLTSLNHFARVTDTTPCHVGDVQQAIDTTQVDECAVLGDVLDHTGHDCAFGQSLHQLGALFAHADFHHRAT